MEFVKIKTMIFNSFTYLIFLALIVILYWQLPKKPRTWMLFLASLTFYGFWRWKFIILILTSTIIDYLAAIAIEKEENKNLRRYLLFTSLIINLGLLAYFKYTYFFIDNINWFFNAFESQSFSLSWNIILPIGISFYTFQTISYTIDVYRRKIPAELNFPIYATYVTFFPQLVAGPILRANEVIWQLKNRSKFSINNISKGLWLLLNGLFLKTVLADRIAPFVDNGFNSNINTLSALDIWVLAFLFGFQIYFDFAGYSMIAIGSARLMGISFPDNFNFPYMASSPRDFWKRWHISLSSWVRDYLYLPLCGVLPKHNSEGGIEPLEMNISRPRKTWALFISWAIMGLWHGANWTFVIWGIWHSFLIFSQRKIQQIIKINNKQITSSIGWLITIPLIMIGWIPFRVNSLIDLFQMIKILFNLKNYILIDQLSNPYIWAILPINIDPYCYLITFILIISLPIIFFLRVYILPLIKFNSRILFAATFAYGFILISLVFIYLQPVQQFIYFAF